MGFNQRWGMKIYMWCVLKNSPWCHMKGQTKEIRKIFASGLLLKTLVVGSFSYVLSEVEGVYLWVCSSMIWVESIYSNWIALIWLLWLALWNCWSVNVETNAVIICGVETKSINSWQVMSDYEFWFLYLRLFFSLCFHLHSFLNTPKFPAERKKQL